MTKPKATSLTPEKALASVRRFSRLNGWSVVIVAALGTFLTLLLGDFLGVGIGLLVVVGGMMEVHGNRRLAALDPKGMSWLVRSQFTVLAVILVYAVSRLGSFDGEMALANLTPEMRAALQELQLDPRELLPLVKLTVFLTYGTVAVVTCVYQGGLGLFYRSRIPLVNKAIAAAKSARPPTVAPKVDQRFYNAVAAEMSAGDIEQGLWARALAESDGQEARCKAIYIRLRVIELSKLG